jgi:hypothetical protein
MKRRMTRPPDGVSASELAEVGVCERRVLLAHRHGARWTSRQRKDLRRGLLSHERFRREGLTEAETGTWNWRRRSHASWGSALTSLFARVGCAVLRFVARHGRRARHPEERA